MIVGLGNPGQRYNNTRHNVGFSVIELLSEQLNLSLKKKRINPALWCDHTEGENKLLLIQPHTFMNRSGEVFPFFMKKHRFSLDQIIVVVDNMDLELGQCRLKLGGGSAGHNGLKSIIGQLSNNNFHRLYIGVGRSKHDSVVGHVLGPFSKEEQPVIDNALRRSADAILDLYNGKSVEEVRNELNRKKTD